MKLFKSSILILSLAFSFFNALKSEAVTISNEAKKIELPTAEEVGTSLQYQNCLELNFDIKNILNNTDQVDKDVMQYADFILNVEEMYAPRLGEILPKNFLIFDDHQEIYNWLTNSDGSVIISALDTALGCSFQRKDQSDDYRRILYVTSLVKFCCDGLDENDATLLKNDLMQHLTELGNKGAHIANVTKAHMFLVLKNCLQYLAKLYSA